MDFLEITPITLTNTNAIDKSQWQRCFFDLEGSLLTKDGNILQLAIIMTDWDFNIINVYNEYYKNDNPIDPAETKIHGIDEEFLKRKRPAGTFLQRYWESPLMVDKPTMFISYTTFDVVRIREELTMHNAPPVNFGKEVESLAYNMKPNENCFYNAFKLGLKKGEKVADEIGAEAFNEIYRELKSFGNFAQKGNHDALYDTVLILALCRRLNNERANERTNGVETD